MRIKVENIGEWIVTPVHSITKDKEYLAKALGFMTMSLLNPNLDDNKLELLISLMKDTTSKAQKILKEDRSQEDRPDANPTEQF